MIKKVEKIDRKTCKDIREYLNDLFGMAYEDIGLKFSIGSMTFSNSDISVKIKMIKPDTNDSDDVDPYELELKNNLKKHGFKFGLSIKDFGKEFTIIGRKYKLMGIKPKSYKYPFVLKDVAKGSMIKASRRHLGV